MAHPVNAKKDAAVVIGGVNMDIWGRPTGGLAMRDSNPGSVRMTPGGVGRNIAHDLRLLGLDVSFVSALGDDLIGRALLERCTEIGLDMSHALVIPGGHSSTYLFVTEAGGDMCAAINDMDICSQLTPAFFEPLLPKLRDGKTEFAYSGGNGAYGCICVSGVSGGKLAEYKEKLASIGFAETVAECSVKELYTCDGLTVGFAQLDGDLLICYGNTPEEIDSISKASTTSGAVVNAVNAALDFFNEVIQEGTENE